ncbi:molybdopterin synthase sulfur carrier subunit [Wyeomyia smithii]|uniref:molybdopterin synthase sulfur carrier subunit n=1 Tax=Wyeomyia smithii TaxID=174621 RepID=UPI002467F1C9|nr:molybdopterin synthase sulfur carrier subunit [Wyeomyia smithii]
MSQGRPTVQVNLLFFAKSRELAGISRCSNFALPTTSGGTSSGLEVLDRICQQFHELNAIRDCVIIAHNEQYCENLETPIHLRDGDEIAVIPPIAGG